MTLSASEEQPAWRARSERLEKSEWPLTDEDLLQAEAPRASLKRYRRPALLFLSSFFLIIILVRLFKSDGENESYARYVGSTLKLSFEHTHSVLRFVSTIARVELTSLNSYSLDPRSHMLRMANSIHRSTPRQHVS